MGLDVQLMGPPSIVRDGRPVPLSGRKPWGLLAFLLLEPQATRREIATRLIPEANDPLASLRWLLHQLRRALEPEATVEESDGVLSIRSSVAVRIDLLELLHVSLDVDAVEGAVRGELLEGMDFDDAPAFEMWLSLQRIRVHDMIAEVLWWMGSRLGTSDPDRAIRITERALAFDPFCETSNELLLDLLVQSGNAPAAHERFAAIERRFHDELGVPPADSVRRPLERPRAVGAAPAGGSARALLASARGRLTAGEFDRAIETSRRAADVALALADPELELASLLLLATTMIHSQTGRNVEAKGLLSRSLQLATDLDDLASLADVEREMGFVFAMEPGYGLAESVLVRSIGHADGVGDDIRAAQAATYLGMCRSDRCDEPAARITLERAIERFSTAHEPGWRGYAEGMLARSEQRSGDPEAAAALAAEAEQHVRRGGWNAVLPWPILVGATCALELGERATAADRFAEALTLGTEIGDACWEGLALRGLALVRAREDHEAAVELLREAAACTRRYPEIYPWARAVILTDLAELELRPDPRDVEEAFELAVSGPMPDLVDRLVPFRDPRIADGLVGPSTAQTRPQTAAL